MTKYGDINETRRLNKARVTAFVEVHEVNPSSIYDPKGHDPSGFIFLWKMANVHVSEAKAIA